MRGIHSYMVCSVLRVIDSCLILENLMDYHLLRQERCSPKKQRKNDLVRRKSIINFVTGSSLVSVIGVSRFRSFIFRMKIVLCYRSLWIEGIMKKQWWMGIIVTLMLLIITQ